MEHFVDVIFQLIRVTDRLKS